MQENYTYIYAVTIFAEADRSQQGGQPQHLFASVGAIYDLFTADEVGVHYSTLLRHGLTVGRAFNGIKARITRERAYTKKQKHPHRKQE